MKYVAASIVCAASVCSAGSIAAEPPAPVAQYVADQITPFLDSLAVLKGELKTANATRSGWSGFSDDWKSWSPDVAEANKSSYNYGEYLWSARKDKAYRGEHTSTAAAKALKVFQDASGGKVAEFFVTDAKGGNVCQTALTSDWFQGDEEKFTAVANRPVDAADRAQPFFAAPKRDDTVGETGIQVSVPLYDGKDFIGVAVALVIVEKL